MPATGWGQRWVMLLAGNLCPPNSKILVYFTSGESTKGCRPKNALILLEGSFSVTNTKSERRGRPFCFRVDVHQNQKKLVFACASAQERTTWMEHLNAAA